MNQSVKWTRVGALLVALTVLTGTPPSVAQTSIKLPVPEIETLPNGLQVAWFLNDKLPVIDLGLVVKSGSRDDEPGKTGTAELLVRALDRGAAGMNAVQIARKAEELGASRFASADDDFISIGVHGLAPDAPVLLDLLGKLALQPDFPPAEVKREQARTIEALNHLPDYSDALVSLAFQRLVRNGTSYARGSISSISEFRKVSRQEVIAFHRKHFTPGNSILLVVGRVDKAEFKKQILAAFGGWKEPVGTLPLERRIWKSYTDRRFPAPRGTDVYVVDRPDLTQAQVRIGFRTPLLQDPGHYSLVVANALLGEYFNSRLNSLIRDKLALTYSIGSSFTYNRDFASFSVASATRNDSVGRLIMETVQVLKELKQGPIAEDESRMAKEYLIGQFPLSTSTLGAVASRWLTGYVFSLSPDYLNEFVPRVSRVSNAEMLKEVSRAFDLDHLAIVVAGDAKEIEKSLAGIKTLRVRRLQPADLIR